MKNLRWNISCKNVSTVEKKCLFMTQEKYIASELYTSGTYVLIHYIYFVVCVHQ